MFLPTGPYDPKNTSKKNPATVGGNTNGIVKIPSQKILVASDLRYKIHLAANSPKIKVNKIAIVAVFIDMMIGDISIHCLLS